MLDYFAFSYHFEVMSDCSSGKYSSIPDEYRKAAEGLFPLSESWPGPEAAADFAGALGIGAEYRRLFGVERKAPQMTEFLGHFRNNLDLLIQKTWVEKADVSRKEKLQDEIPSFMSLIEQEDFVRAIEKFGSVLEELAYLFFGKQSTEEDFAEYTFRIDPQMGLFWWYCLQLGKLKKTGGEKETNGEILWAVLFVGICYLTNF